MPGVFKDKTGQRYGRLTVVAFLGRQPTASGRLYTAYRCQCDCGNVVEVDGASLGKGTFSCGCFRRERMSTRTVVNKTHGLGRTPEYKAWWKLRKNHLDDIPESWNDFETFLNVVGHRPSIHHYLSRPNPEAAFDDDNVSWRTSYTRQLGPHHDLTGEHFGKLKVIERIADQDVSSSRVKWYCRCDCGGEARVTRANLYNGHTFSCGCLKLQLSSIIHTTHGVSAQSKRDYRRWHHLWSASFNPKSSNYWFYGARGITLCDRWANDPRAMVEDMGFQPGDQMRLVRIDKSLGFSKENCRWEATMYRKRLL